MRVPLSWLREFAPVPDTAEELMADLVTVGLEEEDIHRPADELRGPIVVGQVLSMEPETHSNGKTVNWCQVRVVPEGTEQTLTGKGIEPSGVQGIICGAHNFKPGDKVVVTLPGAMLPGGFEITARKTYGHKSAGMIASVRELGIGDDHGGILVLSEIGLDPELGTDAMELLGLYEEAAEVNVTPDRGYAFSLRGIAREFCHATKRPFHDFVQDYAARAPKANDSGYPVQLDNSVELNGKPGTVRFVTRLVKGVNASAPTPPWMAARLRLAGVRSISLPVDISNYVMLETGQPLHFYDADKLNGTLVARRAAAGEKLTTLDEVERELVEQDLVIADASGPIGLAGVMGGASTEVSDSTVNIVVEAARFDEVSIARTARRHKLISEASKRFERGVDPQIQAAAAQRAVELLVELAGGTADEGVTDVALPYEPTVIFLPEGYTASRIGVDYTPEQIESTLSEIGCVVERVESGYRVTVPSWRTDLLAKEDLTEEVARIDGYDNIPSRLPSAPAGRGYTPEQVAYRRVLDSLASSGMTEVFAYPFVSADANNLWSSPEADVKVPSVRLENPISSEQGWMRRSLLPGLVDVLKRNLSRGFKNLALYESGCVFLPGERLGSESIPAFGVSPEESVLDEINAGIPAQPMYVSGLFAGAEHEPMPHVQARPYDWRDAVDAARLVGYALGVEVVVTQGAHQAFHPGRTAALRTAAGEPIGFAGELHPKLLQTLNLPERVCAFELDLDALFASRTGVPQASPIYGYPAATQDVALIVDESIPAADIAHALREGAGELLEHIQVFDDYRGVGIDEGKKSLAFALRFRASDRTLTAEEASASREAAVANAAALYGAVARV